jgi:dienelactone hydrolase
MEMDPGLPGHTIYHPVDLADARLPIIAFANGGCNNVGSRFRWFLSEIASHGYLAVATGPIGAPGSDSWSAPVGSEGAAIRLGQPAPGSPATLNPALANSTSLKEGETRPSFTYAAQLTHAIDWAVAENRRVGSQYFGKLDTDNIAVMGQSCGGLQAIDAAHDPRVRTLVVWNSGLFPLVGRSWEMAAAHADKASLGTLHGTVLYVTGDPNDVAFPQADDDFSHINHLPVWRAWREKTPHSGTYGEPNGGAFGTVAVAWLNWRLKGDKVGAQMFESQQCGLCKQPEWHVMRKGD